MIVNTKTGPLIGGVLIKDAARMQLRNGKEKITFPLRYAWEEPADPGGKKTGKLLDVDLWSDLDAIDQMILKGDAVAVSASEVKSREANGVTYRSVSPDGIYPSVSMVLRWNQQAIDIMSAEVEQLRAEIAELRTVIAASGAVIPVQQTSPVPSGEAQGRSSSPAAYPGMRCTRASS